MADLPIPKPGEYPLKKHADALRSAADAMDAHFRNQMGAEMDNMNERQQSTASPAAKDLGLEK